MSPTERESLSHLPRISVCINTVLLVADGTGDEAGEATYAAYNRKASNFQMETVWATGLFSRVTLAHAPNSRCDVFLVVREVPLELSDFWIVAEILPGGLTFSVIPALAYLPQVDWFIVADPPTEVFRFYCRTYSIAWFPLAPLVAALPGWELRLAEDAIPRSTARECGDPLALFLYENRARIWPRVESAP